MEWIDTHCHLDEDAFTQDCAEAIARAVDAGVVAMVAIGITLDSCRRVIEISERYPQVYATVGLHPNYVSAAQPDDWKQIVELAKSPKVVGLGETGLDKYWDHSPLDLQAEYFDRHLELSQQLKLPFIVHCREAESETVAQLRKHAARSPLNGVMRQRPRVTGNDRARGGYLRRQGDQPRRPDGNNPGRAGTGIGRRRRCFSGLAEFA